MRTTNPTINLRAAGHCVLNKTAHELLTQDGETHVLVYVRNGKIILSPLRGDGLVGAVQIHSREGAVGGTVNLIRALKAAGSPAGHRECVWNDRDGAVEIEVSAKQGRVAA
jgi:hypothetical protein